jgi:hypothetical protein
MVIAADDQWRGNSALSELIKYKGDMI